MPHFRREALHGGLVAGVDEVGRGPLAGPVVAAAVLFLRPPASGLGRLVDDSKKLDAGRREQAFTALRDDPDTVIALGSASVAEIARINILHSSLLAMRRAVGRLAVRPELVLVDGDRCPSVACPAQAVVGGDGECLSIAAASIVAKVVRDRLMQRLDRRHPGYGWSRNAGYGTAAHRDALRRLGATAHHRAGFGAVRQLALGPA
ncbi:MAG: ribonuclease HII [Gluconacetobacter diazotrophicus]|nr:ribonuclease HII [Gluconacetobacter diazotrophicus]